MNSIITQLKKEHDELKGLLEEAENCKVNKREELLSRIEEALVPHARGEEKTFYSLLKSAAEEENDEEALDLANEAYEEHRVVDKLMEDLKSLDPSDEKWPSHLKVIKENIEHHIKEEEGELFSQARNLLSKKQLTDLTDVYLKAKELFVENLPSQAQIKEREPTAQTRKLAS